MEEKEIIEFLKSNKTKGIAFKFLPEEVQEWIKNHWQDCAILTAGGAWDTTRHYLTDENFDFNFDDGNRAFYVFCLLESFTLPKKEKGEWVEFEVNEYGIFAIRDGENWTVFIIGGIGEKLLSVIVTTIPVLEDGNMKKTAFGIWNLNLLMKKVIIAVCLTLWKK